MENAMAAGFVWHERMMWHDAGPSVAVLPARGIYQRGVRFESAETKRRLKNLIDRYELTPRLITVPHSRSSADGVAVGWYHLTGKRAIRHA
jgi:hypothetical protein